MRRRRLSVEEKVFIIQKYYELQGDLKAMHADFDFEFKMETTEAIRLLFVKVVDRFEKTASLKKDFIIELGTIIREEPKERPAAAVSPKKTSKEPESFKIEDATVADFSPIPDDLPIEEESEDNNDDNWNLEPAPNSCKSSSEDEKPIDEEEFFKVQRRPQRKRKPVSYSVDSFSGGDDSEEGEKRPKEVPTICPICGIMCGTREGYKRHKRQKHGFRRSVYCSICEKPCTSENDRITHEETHKAQSERKQTLCMICGDIVYGLKSAMRAHVRKKHSQGPNAENNLDFVCSICGKALKSKEGLKGHMHAHTGQKDYSCIVCGKEFRTLASLTLHQRTHTGERPYKCETCGKAFIDCSSLKVHQRQHTGEVPYACQLCGHSCKQAQNLRSHIRHIHKDHPNFNQLLQSTYSGR